MSIDEDIARLHKAEAAARTRHASATVRHGQEEARAAATREDLQAEFGLVTVEECRAMLAELDGQVAAEVNQVREQLALAGGTQ
jgi:hypothetical protein